MRYKRATEFEFRGLIWIPPTAHEILLWAFFSCNIELFTTGTMTGFIVLPNFEATWRWSRQINPHTNAIRQDTLEWAASFKAFSPKAQRAFDKCDFSKGPLSIPSGSVLKVPECYGGAHKAIDLLTGLLYPFVSKEQLRCCNDLMNLFFIFDEHSDRCETEEVWNQFNMIMDALRNPDNPRPEGEWVSCEVARQ